MKRCWHATQKIEWHIQCHNDPARERWSQQDALPGAQPPPALDRMRAPGPKSLKYAKRSQKSGPGQDLEPVMRVGMGNEWQEISGSGGNQCHDWHTQSLRWRRRPV